MPDFVFMTSAENNATWPGDLNFLMSKASLWEDPNGTTIPVTWEFAQYTGGLFPFNFYECKIIGFNETAVGHSVDRSDLKALQKAFAEAWERLWLKHANNSNPAFSQVENSNGFAAGATNSMAQEKSREELIERAVLIQAWQQKTGWKKVKVQRFKNKLLRIGLALNGWKTHMFEVNSSVGNVLTCFIIHKQLGAIFDSCFYSDLAEEKLLMSVAKNSYFQKIVDSVKLPSVGVPEDHRQFYSMPANSEAFQFLIKGDFSETPAKLFDVDKISVTLLTPAQNFPAVSYASNPAWDKLTWGTQSIKGINSWPHPLA